MSGTTIEAQVRPGSVIAAELAALRIQLQTSLELRVQEALGVRTAHRGGSRDVGARTIVTEGHTLNRVATLEHLRARDERVIAERARELVFARMLERLPQGTVIRSTAVAPGGTRQAVIGVADGGEITLAVDEQGRADLLMDRCELPELDSPEGAVAGCDAEAELGWRFHECWRDSGLQVDADDPLVDDGHAAFGAGA